MIKCDAEEGLIEYLCGLDGNIQLFLDTANRGEERVNSIGSRVNTPSFGAVRPATTTITSDGVVPSDFAELAYSNAISEGDSHTIPHNSVVTCSDIVGSTIFTDSASNSHPDGGLGALDIADLAFACKEFSWFNMGGSVVLGITLVTFLSAPGNVVEIIWDYSVLLFKAVQADTVGSCDNTISVGSFHCPSRSTFAVPVWVTSGSVSQPVASTTVFKFNNLAISLLAVDDDFVAKDWSQSGPGFIAGQFTISHLFSASSVSHLLYDWVG
jgi:hypothetical protein